MQNLSFCEAGCSFWVKKKAIYVRFFGVKVKTAWDQNWSGGEIQSKSRHRKLLRQSGIAATIKKARAKMANRKYTHVSHQYSLDFADAEVIPSEDDGLIERFKFDFKPIDQVSSIDNGSFVDIIGICQKVSEVANFTSKKGTDLTKRTFWIVDHSASNNILSFWYLITSVRDCCNSLSFTVIISSFTVSNSSCSLSFRFTKLSVRAFNAMFSLVSSWALFSLNNSSSIWVSCKTSFFCGDGWKSDFFATL